MSGVRTLVTSMPDSCAAEMTSSSTIRFWELEYATCWPLIVTFVIADGVPRKETKRPSPLSRWMLTPLTRCSTSAVFRSGKLWICSSERTFLMLTASFWSFSALLCPNRTA